MGFWFMCTLICMATLQKKKSRGHTYWQIVESRRVNGKPRPVVLAHLGTAENLLQRLQQGAGKPVKAKVYEFGAVAALWQLADELQLVDLIDEVVPKRSQGLSCGQYLLLAAINRCVAPCSKAALYDWYKTTSLQHLISTSKSSLSSQRFWDHMDMITPVQIAQIEKRLTARIVEQYDIALDTLLFDATNFDTFIDSQTECPIAQRGHAKSKRADLRIIGLAMMVSTEFHIPLFTHAYPGNQNDPTMFSQAVASLLERLEELSGTCEDMTLVFDGGNNSQDNIDELDQNAFHYITSLTLTHHKDLLEVPLNQYMDFPEEPRLEGCRAYRTTKKIWDRERTVVVTRSQTLLKGQIAGIEQALQKKRKALRKLRAKLLRSQHPGAKGKGYTEESIAKHLKEKTSGQYISEILQTEIVKSPEGELGFRFWTDKRAYNAIKNKRLGKRILCTDNEKWSTGKIILGSRAQYHVENAFRQMKDPHWISFSPSFHWTEQKLRVHILYCVLALTMASLLQKKAAEQNLRLSVDHLFTELSGIREVLNFMASEPGKRGALRTTYVLTERNKIQQKLSALYNLDSLRHQ